MTRAELETQRAAELNATARRIARSVQDRAEGSFWWVATLRRAAAFLEARGPRRRQARDREQRRPGVRDAELQAARKAHHRLPDSLLRELRTRER